MTDDESLLVHPDNRDTFQAWKAGEITWKEAVYLCRRDEFLIRCLMFGMPTRFVRAAGWLYDALFERRALQ